jgi:hypothetical protein
LRHENRNDFFGGKLFSKSWSFQFS